MRACVDARSNGAWHLMRGVLRAPSPLVEAKFHSNSPAAVFQICRADHTAHFQSMSSVSVGQRVSVKNDRGADLRGIVRFSGATGFRSGPWIGVELDVAQGELVLAIFSVFTFLCGRACPLTLCWFVRLKKCW